MSEAVIIVSHISKSYRKYRTNIQKINSLLFNKNAGERIEVLKDISFKADKGERIGIIGGSMSGRSTLIRILAGVVLPDSGSAELSGSYVALTDNKLGFDGMLSGRENYVLRCMLLGWTPEEIKERESSVFEFVELSEEIDNPVNTYRKGDANRLGFTISTEMKPEIMFFDESFAYGNKKMTKKCLKRFKAFIEEDERVLVMTISNVSLGRKLCNRGIVLHQGKLVFDGAYDDAITYYKENCRVNHAKSSAEIDKTNIPYELEVHDENETENHLEKEENDDFTL